MKQNKINKNYENEETNKDRKSAQLGISILFFITFFSLIIVAAISLNKNTIQKRKFNYIKGTITKKIIISKYKPQYILFVKTKNNNYTFKLSNSEGPSAVAFWSTIRIGDIIKFPLGWKEDNKTGISYFSQNNTGKVPCAKIIILKRNKQSALIKRQKEKE